MKIGTLNWKTYKGWEPRLVIFHSDDAKKSSDMCFFIDPFLTWQVYYETKGFYNAADRARVQCPSDLSKILNLKEHPLDFFKQTLGLFFKLEGKGDIQTRDNIFIIQGLSHQGCLKPAFEKDLLHEKNISLRETTLKHTDLNRPVEGVDYKWSPPLLDIHTYRDFYTHEQHVKLGFETRGEPIPKSWYEIPVYYKGTTGGFIGHQEKILWPHYTRKLDYELELAVVIGKDGKNIKPEKAFDHIFGFTILNDMSARDIQKKEMAARLGPSKAKDFCSVLGPVIVTRDEFNSEELNLTMTASINGKECSRGQSGAAHFSWNDMISFASQEEWLRSTDVMGSGTVGTGCALENQVWPQHGDEICFEIENIGKLTNKVVKTTK